MKPFLKSKTVWLQIITVLSLLLPQMQAWLAKNPEQVIEVLAALNILMRFATSGKITLFADDAASASKTPGWALWLGQAGLAGFFGFSLPGCATNPFVSTTVTDTTQTTADGVKIQTVVTAKAADAAAIKGALDVADRIIPIVADAVRKQPAAKP